MSHPDLHGGPHAQFSWKRPSVALLAVVAAVIAGIVALLVAWPARGFAPVTDAARVAAGYRHGCLVTTGGAVKCWGANYHGELGNDTLTASNVPVDVQGLASGVAAVAAGNQFACALTTGGGVKCWGWGIDGRLGDSTGVERHTPVNVTGLASGVSAISLGDAHACALTTGGGVKCWGNNTYGQLGDNTNSPRNAPVDVLGLAAGVNAIATGDHHTCALLATGGVKCWGWNQNGQLGDNSTTARKVPTDVFNLTSGMDAVAAGKRHSCARTTAGAVKCWGYNIYGELGDGTKAQRNAPVDTLGLGGTVTTLAAGGYHTCAITPAGGIKCWGGNLSGEAGNGLIGQTLTAPVDTLDLPSGVARIAAGDSHTCAVLGTGGLKCWGRGMEGALGDGSVMNNASPVAVQGLASGAGILSAGGSGACVVTTGGGVKCWPVLADATGRLLPYPVDVPGLASGVQGVSIGAGSMHACAVTSGGGVKCWGRNAEGQLGDTTTVDRATPVDVSGLTSGVSAVSAGALHTCARLTTGGMKCWGYNGSGQLGDNSYAQRTAPVDVFGLTSGVASISAGFSHTCARLSTGGVRCWGENYAGQLGEYGDMTVNVPMNVHNLSTGATAVSAGGAHSCALLSGGAIKCWGANAGQLGNGTDTPSTWPVDVSIVTDAIAITAGGEHTCSLNSSNGVRCWGRNDDGQLADGTLDNRLVPTMVGSLPEGVMQVSAGYTHTCVLTVPGGVKCWGSNDTGQMGNGTSGLRPYPGDVLAAADGTPDAFVFASQADVALESIRTSESIMPAGYDGTAAVTVANGTYAIGCTPPFVATAGTINAGQTVCVRHTAASTPGTPVTTTLTIGGVTGTFTSTTGASVTSTVLAGPAGSSFGDSVTFTATVTGFSPAGAVAFADGATPIGGCEAVTLAAGQAQCTTSALAVGVHPINAAYGGNAQNLPSASSPVIHTVSAPVIVTLAVAKAGNGSGTVTSNPAGIDCGPTCAADFASGTPVTLTPAAATGSTFTSWSGDCAGSGGCQVTMDTGKSVTATFTLQQFTLSVSRAGTGIGTVTSSPAGIDCGSSCAAAFDHGTGVALTAVAAPGSTFAFWSGACTGTGACGVTMDAARSVTASFALDPAGDSDGDGIPNAVELAEGRNPFAKDNDIFASNRLFAMQQYRDFLGREGDAGGVQFYHDLLDSGAAVRANVVESFFSSPEFAGTVSPIVRLYFATFVRIPDYGGLQYQVDAFRSGTPLTVIANNFAASPEFVFRYGTLTDSQYVVRLYSNVLGRTPVQAEVDYHVARLVSGVTRGEVMAGFSESPEFQGGTFNDVYVTMMYVGMLGRAPEQGGFDYWVTYMDTGNPGINLILGFLNAPEYHNRFLP